MYRMALFTAQMIVLSVLILAWPAMCQEPSYLNEFADVVDFNCSSGSAVARILSNALFNDRQWNFECVEVSKFGKEYCETFSAINELRELMLFQCPKNAYMAGIKSEYSAGYNDRVWEVRCCRVLGKCTRECCLSDAINVDGGGINYSPGDGVFFTGIFSDFLFYDRIYYVEQCKASSHCGYRPFHKYALPWAK